MNVVVPDRVPGGGMRSIPVIARLVWGQSEEWWPARAVRWTTAAVMVGVQLDPGDSLSCRYFWLGADDVARVIRPDLSAVEGPVRAK